jgi:DNA (cytosine-5)-methyltransferase 1
LENEGYKVIPIVLPAASVNAPHKRDRVWFVAYFKNKFGRKIDNNETFQYATNSESERYKPLNENRAAIFSTPEKSLLHGRSSYCFDKPSSWENFPINTPVCDGDDGISNRLDSITFSKWRNESIKAGGNAIVPQVVYQIFKAIQEYDYKFRL